jgi:hypothetical protein
VIVSVAGRVLICATAALLEPDASLKAWVERHVRQDPDLRWILGNYVEATEANSNGHIFPLDELVTAQHSLAGKPLNMMHREHYIVGAFAGAQLLHADGGEYQVGDQDLAVAASLATNTNTSTIAPPITPTFATTTNLLYRPVQAAAQPPYVEALAGMWHRRFPEEFFNIRRAHAEGTLFFSMEAIPEDVSCPSCAHRAAYVGVESDTYCEHMQGSTGPKQLHKPNFNGGAIIIPPVKPGWSRADITAISKYIADSAEEASAVYDAVAAASPHLDAKSWEQTMGQIMLMARDFPPEVRKKMGKKGTAMPDGSFPIANAKDLRNAIRAVGRAKDPAAAKAHIKSRAKALGLGDLIPDGW